jgi:hypothetical protein
MWPCHLLTTAYSRRSGEVWSASSDEGDDAASVIGRHVCGEIGGSFVVGFGLATAPFHEEAIGQTGKDAVKSDRVS